MARSPYFYGGGTAPARIKPKQKKTKTTAAGRGTVKTGGLGTSAAQQMVNAALAPLLASIKQQETTAGLSNLRQQDALSGFTKEILSYLKGAPAAIQSDYQGAVDSTRNLARASADQLLKSNPNSLNQADLAAIGAPQAQRDALAAQNQNIFGGGSSVLFKTAGAIPATQFAEDKASAAAFANSLPSIQGLASTQAFQKLLGTQAEGMAKLQAARAEVEAKRPGLLADANAAIAKQRNDDRNYDLRAKSAGLASDRYALSVEKFNSDLKYKTAGLSLAERRVAVSEHNSQISEYFQGIAAERGAAGFYRDKSGTLIPKGYRKTAKGALVPVPSGGAATATVPSVPTVVKDAGMGALESVTDKVWASAWKTARANSDTEEEATAKTQATYDSRLSLSFRSATTKVVQAIAPQLKSLGYSNSQIKVVAHSIVSSRINPPKGYRAPQAPKNVSVNLSYGGGGGVPLVKLLQQAGFSGEGLRIAYGIVLRESGGRPEAFNGNTGTGDRSWGLFQINTLGSMKSRVKQFGLKSEKDLLDPLANAKAAYRMSGGGKDFGAWGIGPNAYRSGAGMDTIARGYNSFPGSV